MNGRLKKWQILRALTHTLLIDWLQKHFSATDTRLKWSLTLAAKCSKKKKWIFIFSLKDVNMHTLLIHNKSQMNKALLSPMQGEMRFSLPCCIFSSDRVTSLTLLGHCHGNGRTRQMPFAPIHFLWPSMNMILGFLSSQLGLTLSEYDPFKGYPSHTLILTCSSTHTHIQA